MDPAEYKLRDWCAGCHQLLCLVPSVETRSLTREREVHVSSHWFKRRSRLYKTPSVAANLGAEVGAGASVDLSVCFHDWADSPGHWFPGTFTILKTPEDPQTLLSMFYQHS